VRLRLPASAAAWIGSAGISGIGVAGVGVAGVGARGSPISRTAPHAVQKRVSVLRAAPQFVQNGVMELV
jgi:hypothetical protein